MNYELDVTNRKLQMFKFICKTKKKEDKKNRKVGGGKLFKFRI